MQWPPLSGLKGGNDMLQFVSNRDSWIFVENEWSRDKRRSRSYTWSRTGMWNKVGSIRRLRLISSRLFCVSSFSLCLPLFSFFLSPSCSRAKFLNLKVSSESPGELSVRRVPVSPGEILAQWSGTKSDHICLFNLHRWLCCALKSQTAKCGDRRGVV